MALDVYVMPISSFVAGRFKNARITNAENLGMETRKRLTNAKTDTVRDPADTLPREDYSQWIKIEVRRAVGVNLDWKDAGDPALSSFISLDSLHGLRSFALNLEFPQAFASDSPSASLDSIERSLAYSRRLAELGLSSERFAHLCNHSDNEGFYIPPAFDPPLRLKDPYKSNATHDLLSYTSIGSSHRLMAELEELNDVLKIPNRWDTCEPGLPPSRSSDQWIAEAQLGWLRLEGLARISLQTDLPICFMG